MGSDFELFRIGIPRSGAHTVGPLVAAGRFVKELASAKRAGGGDIRRSEPSGPKGDLRTRCED